MEEQHKEMLRNLVNGVYDDIDEAYGERAQHYRPGQLGEGGDEPAGPGPPEAGPAPSPPPLPAPGRAAIPAPPPPPSWARPAPPAERHPAGGVGDDLVSEKSLDEVILSYLAEDLGEKK